MNADYGSHDYQPSPAAIPALREPSACCSTPLLPTSIPMQPGVYGEQWGFAPPPGVGMQLPGPAWAHPPTPNATVIVVSSGQAPVAQMPMRLSEHNTLVQCHNCHRVVTTRTSIQILYLLQPQSIVLSVFTHSQRADACKLICSHVNEFTCSRVYMHKCSRVHPQSACAASARGARRSCCASSAVRVCCARSAVRAQRTSCTCAPRAAPCSVRACVVLLMN